MRGVPGIGGIGLSTCRSVATCLFLCNSRVSEDRDSAQVTSTGSGLYGKFERHQSVAPFEC